MIYGKKNIPATKTEEEAEEELIKDSPFNPEDSFAGFLKRIPSSGEEYLKSSNEKLKDFSELLESISSLEDKRKSLWKQIYENSVIDRHYAFMAYLDLYQFVKGNSSEHAIHGVTLTKYLERMGKATDQLTKLAELVQEAKRRESDALENVSEDQIVRNNGQAA